MRVRLCKLRSVLSAVGRPLLHTLFVTIKDSFRAFCPITTRLPWHSRPRSLVGKTAFHFFVDWPIHPPQVPVTGIPEYPITLKHKPPVDLDKHMPNPGTTHGSDPTVLSRAATQAAHCYHLRTSHSYARFRLCFYGMHTYLRACWWT